MIRPHILFADDDCDIRDLVQFQLNAAGFRVSTADNGQMFYDLSRLSASTFCYWTIGLRK